MDSHWRIFQKIRHAPRLTEARLELDDPFLAHGPRKLVNLLNSDRAESLSFTKLLECYDLVLGEFVTSGLLLDEKRNILHVFGDANQYLLSKTGRFSGNLQDFLSGDAKVSITAALIGASRQPGKIVILEDVRIDTGVQSKNVTVHVRALSSLKISSQVWFVEFVDRPPVPPNEQEDRTIRVEQSSSNLVELESELVFTKDSLNATIEELEASNEELQAANEELVASNEELQSTNEELQSVNEELHTVNLEYKQKLDELEELMNDFDILMSSQEVGTIFLDRDLCIRKFNTAATRYLNLVAGDVGRHLDNFTYKFKLDHFYAAVAAVVEHGNESIHRAIDDSGNAIVVKITPHRSQQIVDGVIINIDNHSALQKLEVDRAMVPVNRDTGFWEWPDTGNHNMWWSPHCFHLLELGTESDTASFSTWKTLTHPDDVTVLERLVSENSNDEPSHFVSLRMKCGNHYKEFGLHRIVVHDSEGHPISMRGSLSLIENGPAG